MSTEFIMDIANKARAIMEEHHNDLSSVYFGDFPFGACGNISDMLALYMSKKGIKEIAYVWGRRQERTHGWLEIKETIVDITSDQFSDGLGAVYVGKANEFHNSFGEQTRSSPSVPSCLIESYNKFEHLMDEKI